ncbi:MAG: ABC transporter transmembrane domain-containing protein [Clostridium sp.]
MIPLVTLEKKNSVEITNSLIEDVDYVSENLILPATQLLTATTSFIIGFVVMLKINYILTLIILPCGIITSLSARIIQNKSIENISTTREKSIALWKIFAEWIRGIMPI